LERKIGGDEAKALAEYVQEEVHEQVENSKTVLATKEDVQKLEVKMAQFEARITRWMFIFWAGQIGVLIAVLKLFFKS